MNVPLSTLIRVYFVSSLISWMQKTVWQMRIELAKKRLLILNYQSYVLNAPQNTASITNYPKPMNTITLSHTSKIWFLSLRIFRKAITPYTTETKAKISNKKFSAQPQTLSSEHSQRLPTAGSVYSLSPVESLTGDDIFSMFLKLLLCFYIQFSVANSFE